LILGVQKVAHLTNFHPRVLLKLVNLARHILSDQKAQNIQSVLNLLYVANNFKLKYSRLIQQNEGSEKMINDMDAYVQEVNNLNFELGQQLINIKMTN
jgi:hypothetical protein